MVKKHKFVICFAGAIGSSKTPISNYLSYKLNLPVFNNDALRTEVIEDLGSYVRKEHERRLETRLTEIVTSGVSVIIDASVDRRWQNYQDVFAKNNYRWFIISLDLSKEFMQQLYRAKNYRFETEEEIDQNLADHERFLENFREQVALHITDQDFPNRLEICLKAVEEWLKKLQ